MNPLSMDRRIATTALSDADTEPRVPNAWRTASFFVRSNGLKALRVMQDLSRPFKKPDRSSEMFPVVAAESVSPLRYVRHAAEKVFEEGKIKNLKLACERINGSIIQPSSEFSFWRIVGRPRRGSGFVVGREIREGCLIPTVGGGLCQLSGSLHSVAAEAGMTILERHRHTRRLQDVYFDESRDATIFWNYVDLRFSSEIRFQIGAIVTEQDLVVTLRTEQPVRKRLIQLESGAIPVREVSDCLACDQYDCSQSHKTMEAVAIDKQVVLADKLSPEFHAFLQSQLRANDIVLSPTHGTLESKGLNYPVPIIAEVFPWARIKRSAMSRLGRRRKIAASVRISGAKLLAESYRQELRKSPDSYLFIEQELLPHLWESGALYGGKYCVLASRLPSSILQHRLDLLYERYPDRNSLAEFRMPAGYCEAEDRALEAADRIVSSHEEVAQSVARCERLPWIFPETLEAVPAATAGRDAFLFPGITAAREGAYEVRAAALELGLNLVVFEKNIEHPDFWRGVDISYCSPDSIPWQRIATVVHPAVFISSPRAHLQAIASGVPIVASRGCGLPDGQMVTVDTGSVQDLIFKIGKLKHLETGRCN